jgi:tetraprenyl-beta-curcumene synthase
MTARAVLALLLANVRYWRTVARLVRGELARWEERARAIADPELRAQALAKLERERFNAEAGAMLATLAPLRWRAETVRAIVALEVIFDLLDGLSERPLADPLRDGEELFEPFTGALLLPGEGSIPQSPDDGGYLHELADTTGAAFGRLPAAEAVREAAQRCAARAAQAQIRMHAVPSLGTGQLRDWAQAEAEGTGLDWREFSAGAASSVLAVHALLAAAADPSTTRAQADAIERCYLSVCVLLTLLDGLVDRAQDARAGRVGYLDLFEGPGQLSQTFAHAARRAVAETRELPNAPTHLAMCSGVVAYYASAAGARSELARPVLARLRRELGPLLAPTLLVMRAWRLARPLRSRLGGRPGAAGGHGEYHSYVREATERTGAPWPPRDEGPTQEG